MGKTGRLSVVLTWVGIGILFIVIGSFTFGSVKIGSFDLAAIVLGKTKSANLYPLTLQNLMIITFCVGLAYLTIRRRSTAEENFFLDRSAFLPEEKEASISTDAKIDEIRNQVSGTIVKGDAFLPDVINTCITQYKKTGSISDTIAVLNSTMELNNHKLDLRYSAVRYIVWAIPTMGFIGTVLGLSGALGGLQMESLRNPDMFTSLVTQLGLAFDTTLIALVLSGILVLIFQWVQKEEERCLNRVGKYVLTHLINKLTDRSKQSARPANPAQPQM
jgi:biopolymer transport protein ExbB/TolQ